MSSREHRLRRFRLAVALTIAVGWGFLIECPVQFGWRGPIWPLIVRASIDTLLLAFAWRKPWGIATTLIVLWLMASAALVVAIGPSTIGWIATGIDLALAPVLVVTAVGAFASRRELLDEADRRQRLRSVRAVFGDDFDADLLTGSGIGPPGVVT